MSGEAKVGHPPYGFILAVVAAGVLATVGCALVLPTGPVDWPIFVVLTTMASAAAMVPIRFVRGAGTQGFTLEGGVLVAMLFSLPLGLAPVAYAGASLLAHGVRSAGTAKAAFNAGRTGVETTAGTLVFWLLAPSTPSPTDPRSLVALAVAAIVYEATSIAGMTELFHRMSSITRREAAREVGQLSLLTFAANTVYGIVLAAVALVSPWITALSALLMIGLYVGFRGYAAAVEDQRRAEALHEMTSMLLDLPGGHAQMQALLQRLVAVFGGARGELLVDTGGDLARWVLTDDGVTVHPEPELPRSGLLATVIARGEWTLDAVTHDDGTSQDVLGAPINMHGEAVGAVAVVGRRGLEPWDQADAMLLAAVANELGVALDNVSLFGQVEEERARLEAESTKLNDILGAASDGIASILADGSIEAWNPGMAQITGVPVEAAVGQPWHAVLRLKSIEGHELAPTGDHVVRRAVVGEFAGGSLSLQALRADGTWRWLQCTSSPVRDPDGQHRGVVVVARDVTREREIEDLKSDFIATVSHELRTPLTPLKGFLATLRNPRTTLTEDQLGSIHGSMSAQLARLETLISDLLAVAELDHGQFDLHPEPMALGEIVAEAVEVEAAHEFSRCTVVVEPDVTAVADPVALVRILRSLVSNAVKHTDGRVEVAVRSVGDEVHVAVSDEGPGIASWDHQKVFNRFERLGNHLRRTQGPGLGLTIARTLAQRMDGDVTVSSDIGAGATFTLHLPRAKPRAVRLRAVSEA